MARSRAYRIVTKSNCCVKICQSSHRVCPFDKWFSNLHLQSAPGQFQMLFIPDIVVELSCKTLNRTICLVRVLDNEGSLKLILELSDEFWEEV